MTSPRRPPLDLRWVLVVLAVALGLSGADAHALNRPAEATKATFSGGKTYNGSALPDPTEEKDALGGIKKFTYDEAWNIMTVSIDQAGRRTENEVDAQYGRRQNEVVTSAGAVARVTYFDYEIALPGFLSKKILPNSLPGQHSLVTRYIKASDGSGNVGKEVAGDGTLDLTTESEPIRLRSGQAESIPGPHPSR